MHKRTVLAAIALLASGHFVYGEDITGVYARSQELCDKARTEGIEAVAEAGELILTARGFESVEFQCQFVRTDGRGGDLPGFVATAFCEEPGYAYPDLMTVTPRGEGELEVTSLREGDSTEGGMLAGLWYLCAGVERP